MFFKITKKEFLNGLTTASRAISNFSPLPCFSGIKIEALDDRLILTGSDSDISIQTTIFKNDENQLMIHDMGSIVIESKYILEIVRKLETEIIEFEMIDGILTKISGSNSEFKLHGMNADDYPLIDFSQPMEVFTIEKDLLRKLIAQTSFAVSDKEIRPVLTGVNFSCENNLLHAVATDSYRLAKKTVSVKENVNFNITIPAKSLYEIYKVIDLDGQVTVAVNDKKAQFIVKDTIIQTRLIDGVYPETSRLIPLSFDYSLIIDTQELIGAIDRASFIKSEGISIIKFNLSEKECILSTNSMEVGSSKEVLSTASYEGDNLEISCNGKYVFDAIKVLDGELIKISFCGEMKPFIIQSIGDETVLQLVLPVRTYA